jgi:hypothetical protein
MQKLQMIEDQLAQFETENQKAGRFKNMNK